MRRTLLCSGDSAATGQSEVATRSIAAAVALVMSLLLISGATAAAITHTPTETVSNTLTSSMSYSTETTSESASRGSPTASVSSLQRTSSSTTTLSRSGAVSSSASAASRTNELSLSRTPSRSTSRTASLSCNEWTSSFSVSRSVSVGTSMSTSRTEATQHVTGTQSLTVDSSRSETLSDWGSASRSVTPPPTPTRTTLSTVTISVSLSKTTVTPPPTPSATKSRTDTREMTRSQTGTGTFSTSEVITATPSRSVTRSASVTQTLSGSASAVHSPSLRSVTASETDNTTGTRSRSWRKTNSSSLTPSQAASSTQSVSSQRTASETLNATSTRTNSKRVSRSHSVSSSEAASVTVSRNSVTRSHSRSRTGSASASSSRTSSVSMSPSATSTTTPSRTFNVTTTKSRTTSRTVPTKSHKSPTRSTSDMVTSTKSYGSRSSTPSHSATASASLSRSASASQSPSSSYSSSLSSSRSMTRSPTFSASWVASTSETSSLSETYTSNVTVSVSQTKRSVTRSRTSTVNVTATRSRTRTKSLTVSVDPCNSTFRYSPNDFIDSIAVDSSVSQFDAVATPKDSNFLTISRIGFATQDVIRAMFTFNTQLRNFYKNTSRSWFPSPEASNCRLVGVNLMNDRQVSIDLQYDPQLAFYLRVQDDYLCNVTFSSDVFQCQRLTNLTFNFSATITVLGSPQAFPSLMEIISSLGTSLLAMATGGGAALLQQSRAATLTEFAVCQFSLVEPLSVNDSPTQIGFGNGVQFYNRGAVVGNLALIVFFLGVCFLGVVVATLVGKRRRVVVVLVPSDRPLMDKADQEDDVRPAVTHGSGDDVELTTLPRLMELEDAGGNSSAGGGVWRAPNHHSGPEAGEAATTGAAEGVFVDDAVALNALENDGVLLDFGGGSGDGGETEVANGERHASRSSAAVALPNHDADQTEDQSKIGGLAARLLSANFFPKSFFGNSSKERAGRRWTKDELRSCEQRIRRETFREAFMRRAGTIAFPSVVCIPMFLLIDSTVTASVRLIRFPVNIRDRVIGGLGLGIYIAFSCGIAVICLGFVRRRAAKPETWMILVNEAELQNDNGRTVTELKKSTKLQQLKNASQPLVQLVQWLFVPPFDYQPAFRRHQRVLAMLSYLFDESRFAFFILCDVGLTMLMSVLLGLAVSSPAVCLRYAIVCFVFYLLFFVVLVVLRPNVTRFGLALGILVAAIGVASCGCIVGAMVLGSSGLMRVSQILNLATLYVSSCQMAGTVMGVLFWIRKQHVKRLRDKKKGEPTRTFLLDERNNKLLESGPSSDSDEGSEHEDRGGDEVGVPVLLDDVNDDEDVELTSLQRLPPQVPTMAVEPNATAFPLHPDAPAIPTAAGEQVGPAAAGSNGNSSFVVDGEDEPPPEEVVNDPPGGAATMSDDVTVAVIDDAAVDAAGEEGDEGGGLDLDDGGDAAEVRHRRHRKRLKPPSKVSLDVLLKTERGRDLLAQLKNKRATAAAGVGNSSSGDEAEASLMQEIRQLLGATSEAAELVELSATALADAEVLGLYYDEALGEWRTKTDDDDMKGIWESAVVHRKADETYDDDAWRAVLELTAVEEEASAGRRGAVDRGAANAKNDSVPARTVDPYVLGLDDDFDALILAAAPRTAHRRHSQVAQGNAASIDLDDLMPPGAGGGNGTASNERSVAGNGFPRDAPGAAARGGVVAENGWLDDLLT